MVSLKKKMIGVGVSAAMAAAMCVPAIAFAAGDSTGVVSPSSTDINIEAKATTVKMTVPTTATFVFNEDGSNTYPTDFTITNNSSAKVVLQKAVFTEVNSWKLQEVGYDFSNTKDARELSLKLGNKEETLVDVAKNETSSKWEAEFNYNLNKNGVTDGSDSLTFGWEADRGYYATAISSEKALTMELHFDLPTD